MRPSAAALAALLAALAPPTLAAETLTLPAASSARASATLPARGMSMASVEARYGAPVRRLGAVGAPPISRWVYREFVVYFEHDHVVHAINAVTAPATP